MHRQTTGLASLLLAAAAAPLWAQDTPPAPPVPDAPPAPRAPAAPQAPAEDASLELYTQASLLMHQEAYARARAHYERLVEDYPQSPLRPEGLYWLGYCDEQLGQTAQARAAYERLLAQAPDSQWSRDAERRLTRVALPAPKLGIFQLHPAHGEAREVVVTALHPQIVLADGQRLAWDDVVALRREGAGLAETIVLENGDQISGVILGATPSELEVQGERCGRLLIPHQRVLRVTPQGRAHTSAPLYAAPLQALARRGALAGSEQDQAQLLLELAEARGERAEGQAARRAALMALAARGDGEHDVDVQIDGDGRKVIVERRRDADGNVIVEKRVIEGEAPAGGVRRVEVRPAQVDEEVEVLLEGDVDEGRKRVILRRGDKTVEVQPRAWVERDGQRVLVFGDEDDRKVLVLREGDAPEGEHGAHPKRVLLDHDGAVIVLEEDGDAPEGQRRRVIVRRGPAQGDTVWLRALDGEDGEDGDAPKHERRRIELRLDDLKRLGDLRHLELDKLELEGLPGQLKERLRRELKDLDVDVDLQKLQGELRGALEQLPEGVRERVEQALERELGPDGRGVRERVERTLERELGPDGHGPRWVERLEQDGPKVYRKVIERLHQDGDGNFSFGFTGPRGEGRDRLFFTPEGNQDFAFGWSERRPETDRVFLDNGDVISGKLERIDGEHVVLTTAYGKVEIDRDHAVKILFRDPKPKAVEGGALRRAQPARPTQPQPPRAPRAPEAPRSPQAPQAPQPPQAPLAPRPFLGVSLDGAEGEVRVNEVFEGSAAAEAGVEPGDVILRLNGAEIGSYQDLQRAIGELEVGDRIRLRVRRGEEERTLRARLGTRAPASAPRAEEREEAPPPRRPQRSLLPQAPAPSVAPSPRPAPEAQPAPGGQKLYRF